MSRFAGDIVNRLFSAGLSLESARSIVGKAQPGIGSRPPPTNSTA
jgi:hypothetical protein